MSKVKVTIH